jgi:hypothetical protein
MAYNQAPKGVTLIETILYVGLLALLVSSFVALLMQLTIMQSRTSIGGRLAENAAIALHFASTSLPSAQTVDITGSTLGSATSVLKYTNAAGATVTIDTVVTPIVFSGITQNVRRLRYQSGGVTSYLTDAEVNVVVWQVDDVRTTSSDLSGLNFILEVEILNEQASGYRQGTVRHQTTVGLTSLTTEL